MWRQSFSDSPTTDKSWQKKGDNLRQWHSIFTFDKATCFCFPFLDSDVITRQRDSFVAKVYKPINCCHAVCLLSLVLALHFCSTVAPRYNEVSQYRKKHSLKWGLRYSEDPIKTNYLVNSKNIRYSGVTKLDQAEQWDIHQAKQSTAFRVNSYI